MILVFIFGFLCGSSEQRNIVQLCTTSSSAWRDWPSWAPSAIEVLGSCHSHWGCWCVLSSPSTWSRDDHYHHPQCHPHHSYHDCFPAHKEMSCQVMAVLLSRLSAKVEIKLNSNSQSHLNSASKAIVDTLPGHHQFSCDVQRPHKSYTSSCKL